MEDEEIWRTFEKEHDIQAHGYLISYEAAIRLWRMAEENGVREGRKRKALEIAKADEFNKANFTRLLKEREAEARASALKDGYEKGQSDFRTKMIEQGWNNAKPAQSKEFLEWLDRQIEVRKDMTTLQETYEYSAYRFLKDNYLAKHAAQPEIVQYPCASCKGEYLKIDGKNYHKVEENCPFSRTPRTFSADEKEAIARRLEREFYHGDGTYSTLITRELAGKLISYLALKSEEEVKGEVKCRSSFRYEDSDCPEEPVACIDCLHAVVEKRSKDTAASWLESEEAKTLLSEALGEIGYAKCKECGELRMTWTEGKLMRWIAAKLREKR